MVEFALVSIVAFMLMFGMAQFGLIVLGNSTGSNAARDGARVGLINYIDADDTTSANYALIEAAVQKRLSNNVKNVAVTVRCLRGDNQAVVSCDTTNVDLTRGDLIEVKATWNHKTFGFFVSTVSGSSTARMVIGGKPDLTSVSTSSTSSTSSSSTSSSSTTSTTASPSKFSMSSLQMQDVDSDGRVDQVVATFSGGSGTLPASCNAGWSLADVPSGGTLGSVPAPSGSVVTLPINEGPGAQDTAVRSFTVTFSPSGACATDVQGFSTSSPSDAAGPVPISISDTGGTTDGMPQVGDTLTITFSEPVSTGSLSTPTTATFVRPNSQNASINIASFTNGALDTGTQGYIKQNKTATFTTTLAATGNTVTATLGTCSGNCGDLQTGTGNFAFAPSAALMDARGISATGSTSASSISLF